MTNIDRLSIRERPDSMPIGRQTWGKLLFMHWRIPVERLRSVVPAELEIDTYEGEAWIAVVPFTIWGMRASFLPPVPGLSEMHELNVRTYVHYKGVPGVLFLSLDATSTLAVLGARTFFLLPESQAGGRPDRLPLAPHARGRAGRRLRRHLADRLPARSVPTRLARILPHRALLLPHRPRGRGLSMPHPPPTLAAQRRRSLNISFDHDRIARPPHPVGRAAAALRRGADRRYLAARTRVRRARAGSLDISPAIL
jgi:uncharacterized protein YqjF (DUF2071 family)